MKTIIFLFALVLAIGIISSPKYSAKEMKSAEASISNVKSTGKDKIAPKVPLKALFIINKDEKRPQSLWWSYQNYNSGENGC